MDQRLTVAEIRRKADNVLPGHGTIQSTADRLRAMADRIPADVMPDTYGEGAFLQAFEAEVARTLGKADAVFMPSGTMAQQIALRIHCDRAGQSTVAMHPTTHLEIAEQGGLAFLHGIQRLRFGNVELLDNRMLTVSDFENLGVPCGAVLLELPYRPLGGKLPDWESLTAISGWARDNGVAIHLDGARLWTCEPYYGRSVKDITALFDSVYVSFYKDLGGIAGCMLLGDEGFIAESRVWQRRYGGNLHDQGPFVAAAWIGFHDERPHLPDRVARAVEIAAAFSEYPGVRVDPDPPHVNFFRLYLPGDATDLTARHHELADETGTFLFGGLAPATVPGYATTEIHCFGASASFDLERLRAFLPRLLG